MGPVNNFWPDELRQGDLLPRENEEALLQPKARSRFLWKTTENAAKEYGVNAPNVAKVHFGRIKQAYRLTSYGLIEKIKNLFGQMRADATELALKERINGYVTQINLANTELNRLDQSIIERNQDGVIINDESRSEMDRIDRDVLAVSQHVDELIKSLKGTRFEKIYKKDLEALKCSSTALENNRNKTHYMAITDNQDQRSQVEIRVRQLERKINETKRKRFPRAQPADKYFELTEIVAELDKIMVLKAAKGFPPLDTVTLRDNTVEWIRTELDRNVHAKSAYKQSILDQVASIEEGLYKPGEVPTHQALEDAKRSLQVIKQSIIGLGFDEDQQISALFRSANSSIDLAFRGSFPNRDVTTFAPVTLISNSTAVGRACDVLAMPNKLPLANRLREFAELEVRQNVATTETIYSNDEELPRVGIQAFVEDNTDDYIVNIQAAMHRVGAEIGGLLECIDPFLMEEPLENLRLLVGVNGINISLAENSRKLELEFSGVQKASLRFTCVAEVRDQNDQLIGYIACKRTLDIPSGQAEEASLQIDTLRTHERTKVEDRYGAFTSVAAGDNLYAKKNQAISSLPV